MSKLVSDEKLARTGGKLLVKGVQKAVDGELDEIFEPVVDKIDDVFDFSGIQRLRRCKKKSGDLDVDAISTLAPVAETVLEGESIVNQVDCDRQGTKVAIFVLNGKDTLRVFNSEGQLQSTWSHTGYMRRLAFPPQGDMLATSDYKAVYLWKVPDGDLLAKLKTWREVTAIAFNSDGTWFVTANSKYIECWDSSGRFLRRLRHGLKEVARVRFNVNDSILAVAGRVKSRRQAEGMVQLWDPRSLKVVANLGGFSLPVLDVAFGVSGRELYVGSHDSSVSAIFPYQGYQRLEKVIHEYAAFSLAISRCGRILLSGGNRKVYFWRSSDLKPLARMETSGAKDLEVMPDGRILTRVGYRAKIWSVDWPAILALAA